MADVEFVEIPYDQTVMEESQLRQILSRISSVLDFSVSPAEGLVKLAVSGNPETLHREIPLLFDQIYQLSFPPSRSPRSPRDQFECVLVVAVPVSLRPQLREAVEIFVAKAQADFGVSIKVADDYETFQVLADAEALTRSFSVFFSTINVPEKLKDFLKSKNPRVDITGKEDLFIGERRSILNYLQRQHGVELEAVEEDGHCFIEVVGGEAGAVEVFCAIMQQLASNPRYHIDDLARLKEQHVHVFMDLSNIRKGLQRNPDGSQDFRRELDVSRMADLVSDLRTVSRRFVAGSHPHSRHALWDDFRAAGFEARFLVPVMIDGKAKEDAVDEVIHGAALSDISKCFSQPRTLILLTGDGNDNHGGTNFPGVLELALRNGWNVEVWSWEKQTAKVYIKFEKTYPGQFKLKYLDNHRDSISKVGIPQGGGKEGGPVPVAQQSWQSHTPCRFGSRCKNDACAFKHPEGGGAAGGGVGSKPAAGPATPFAPLGSAQGAQRPEQPSFVRLSRSPTAPFHCVTCGVSCTSKTQLEQHRRGQKHLDNVEKAEKAIIAPEDPTAEAKVQAQVEASAAPLVAHDAAPKRRPCINGKDCYSKACMFEHPLGWKYADGGGKAGAKSGPTDSSKMSSKACKHGAGCWLEQCHFAHPPGWDPAAVRKKAKPVAAAPASAPAAAAAAVAEPKRLQRPDPVSEPHPAEAYGISPEIYEMLFCPLSNRLMEDPVYTPEGTTYDRASISEHIRQSGACPVTLQPLRETDLQPNMVIRSMVSGLRA